MYGVCYSYLMAKAEIVSWFLILLLLLILIKKMTAHHLKSKSFASSQTFDIVYRVFMINIFLLLNCA